VECSSFAIVVLEGLLGYGFAQLLPKVSRPIDRDREGVRNWAVRRVTKTTTQLLCVWFSQVASFEVVSTQKPSGQKHGARDSPLE